MERCPEENGGYVGLKQVSIEAADLNLSCGSSTQDPVYANAVWASNHLGREGRLVQLSLRQEGSEG